MELMNFTQALIIQLRREIFHLRVSLNQKKFNFSSLRGNVERPLKFLEEPPALIAKRRLIFCFLQTANR